MPQQNLGCLQGLLDRVIGTTCRFIDRDGIDSLYLPHVDDCKGVKNAVEPLQNERMKFLIAIYFGTKEDDDGYGIQICAKTIFIDNDIEFEEVKEKYLEILDILRGKFGDVFRCLILI